MSTDASADGADTPDDEAADDTEEYDEMLDTLDVAIDEARRKIESGRVYDEQKEKVRQGWIRVLAYTMNVRRQVANDRDLQELADRVEALEAAADGEGLKEVLRDE
jgi:hypothetical protein